MKRKIVANIFLSIGVVLALAAVVPVKTLIGQAQPAQTSKALTKTLNVESKGITVRYPEGWSTGQPTLSSWVILNVPADPAERCQAHGSSADRLPGET